MRERIAEVLAELMALPGPTGREDRVLAWLEQAWASRVERLWRSRVGNLLAYVGGSGSRLLLTAHADELSFVVRSIDPSGLLWLTTGQVRGEPQERFPVGQPALILSRHGTVEGIFVLATGHVIP
ncbi:MAG: M42 family peptidase, partial [Thermomicrobium sp.]|nr:M42 family peptidase [Thermomicrobium sp.]